jgi:large subunit ribosomal protein L9
MKVILLADVSGVGKKGDTANVSDGYGVNYLIPHKLAVVSTPENQAKLMKNNAEEELEAATA